MSNHPQDATPAFSSENCWLVIERAAASPGLKRAARLREFLLYVGAQSIKEGRTSIHEQEIGQSVFGRHDSYDTSQDNIVRVSATELRKRIEAYFASEGRNEPIVFDIPRGSYAPCFRLRAAAVPEPRAANNEPAAAIATALRRRPVVPWRRLFIGVSLAAILLAAACLLLWRQNQSLSRRLNETRQHDLYRQ